MRKKRRRSGENGSYWISYSDMMAGSAKSYNRRWTKIDGRPLHWIAGAGHNANTDAPEEINALIEEFVRSLR